MRFLSLPTFLAIVVGVTAAPVPSAPEKSLISTRDGGVSLDDLTLPSTGASFPLFVAEGVAPERRDSSSEFTPEKRGGLQCTMNPGSCASHGSKGQSNTPLAHNPDAFNAVPNPQASPSGGSHRKGSPGGGADVVTAPPAAEFSPPKKGQTKDH